MSKHKQHPFIGKYVIARCYSAGVHAGTVTMIDGDKVTLEGSTRLWRWKADLPKDVCSDGAALSSVARYGITTESKVDATVTIYLTGVCELIAVSPAAEQSIRSFRGNNE